MNRILSELKRVPNFVYGIILVLLYLHILEIICFTSQTLWEMVQTLFMTVAFGLITIFFFAVYDMIVRWKKS